MEAFANNGNFFLFSLSYTKIFSFACGFKWLHFDFVDAGRVQVSSDSEEISSSEAPPATTVHFKAAENANKVFRTAVAQGQYENYVSYLPESQASANRRLGLWKWYSILVIYV